MRLAVARQKSDLEGLSDEELVEIARQGGEYAIRLLVKRNNRRLFRVARAVVRDDAEAEDIVQETYVSAFTKLGSFRGHSRFSTWLTRIASTRRSGGRESDGLPPNWRNWIFPMAVTGAR